MALFIKFRFANWIISNSFIFSLFMVKLKQYTKKIYKYFKKRFLPITLNKIHEFLNLCVSKLNLIYTS